jgi:uncharacterized protein
MDIAASSEFVINKLKKELSSDLYYHSVFHTLDVHDAAVRVAKEENINGHELLLLRTAAYFHDSGLTITYAGHEEASMEIARNYLPEFGYTKDEIELISEMILKTKLPQSAKTKLEQILCDADLDYLGRDDFFMIAHRLRCEWNIYAKPTTLKEWYLIQALFLEKHEYFTESAKKLRCEKKNDNLQQVKELLGLS